VATPGEEDRFNQVLHRLGHELRNGLNALQMSNYLLLQAELGATEHDVVDRNAATIRDLRDLVDLAVRVSDLQVGNLPIARSREDAASVLEEAAESLRKAMPDGAIAMVGAAARGLAVLDTDPALLAWVLRAVARSGFIAAEPAVLQLGLERRGREVAFTLGRGATRDLPPPSFLRDPRAANRRAQREDIELAAACEVAAALGGRLAAERDRAPPAWVLMLPTA
jgi:hypothetical protein